MSFQAAIIRGLEWAEFATEWFMVSMVSLHMAIQTWQGKGKKKRKQNIREFQLLVQVQM